MKKEYLQEAVVAAIPFFKSEELLDLSVKRYFAVCFALAALIALAYIFVKSAFAHPESNWMGLAMMVWLPVAYSMRDTFLPLQDVLAERTTGLFLARIAVCLIGTLGGIYAMMKITASETPLLTSLALVPLAAYGTGLWNTQLLLLLLNWRMFDRGGIIAAVLSALLGIFLYFIGKN